MDDIKSLFTESAEKILNIVDAVRPDEIDTYAKYQEIMDKSFRLRTIVSVWKEEQEVDRNLRSKYAKILLSVLGIEILLAAILIFLICFNIVQFQEWVINIFYIGIFSQTSSLVIVIVKYLFPDLKTEFLKLLEKI